MKYKNQRRFPTDMEILGDKGFNDIIYCLLQVESNHTEGEEHRYISKEKVNKKQWANTLGMNLRTFNRKFKELLDSGKITEQGDYYIIPRDISKYYYMMPVETMKFLCDTANDDVIKVYSYLGRLYENGKGEGYFTKKHLIEVVLGAKGKNKREWEKINNILDCLKNNGLIVYEEQYEKYKNNTICKCKIVVVNKRHKR